MGPRPAPTCQPIWLMVEAARTLTVVLRTADDRRRGVIAPMMATTVAATGGDEDRADDQVGMAVTSWPWMTGRGSGRPWRRQPGLRRNCADLPQAATSRRSPMVGRRDEPARRDLGERTSTGRRRHPIMAISMPVSPTRFADERLLSNHRVGERGSSDEQVRGQATPSRPAWPA